MTAEKSKIDNIDDYKYFKSMINVQKHGSMLKEYKHFESQIYRENL